VLQDDDGDVDDGFGPGSDLVLSFLGIVLLLLGVTMVTGLPKAKPATVAAAQEVAAGQSDALRAKALERRLAEWEQRALRAEGALAATRAAARAASSAAVQPRVPPRGVPNGVVPSSACQVLLSRGALGDPLTAREQAEMRNCLATR
jgi:hypothetical protein